ncbi:MAG: 16S rRNA (uracil(1498)-N(3))-methyltransferase [Deltaproteobacteria bacterium]|nr:16S rRNA (uracil(1498)-N(3))-methyltransferase [Deltaproteobacteria bacterium]
MKNGELTVGSKVTVGMEIEARGALFSELAKWLPRGGEAVTVSDNDGRLFRVRITSLKEDAAVLTVFEDTGFVRRPGNITLLQALPEKERMELIIQKTTELGVDTIVPLKSTRSITLDERNSKQKKSHKWEAIALKAAKQSRRASIPVIAPYVSFEDALKAAPSVALKLMLKEGHGFKHIKEALSTDKRQDICVLVGPEGGFTDEEQKKAEASGFTPVTLGSNVLRTETAAIAAVTAASFKIK